MTRGQIAIITEDKRIVTSTEFNGDMYPSWHGKEVFELLEHVNNEKEYKNIVTKFNNKHFNYNEKLIYHVDNYSFEEMMDMSNGYFCKWFSDYIYIKNLSDCDVEWTDAYETKRSIASGETIAINFGKYTGLTNMNIKTYINLSERFPELSNKDAIALVDSEKADRVCGIYADKYDIGKSYVSEVCSIDDWLNNNRYIKYDMIGEDIIEDTNEWFELPSGKYAHIG